MMAAGTFSFFFVDRDNPDAPQVPARHAEDWVQQYLNGDEGLVCYVCERPFALPEPPPRYHVVFGRLDGALVTGGICDACAALGQDHCFDGIEKHYGFHRLKESILVRPHQVSATAGRA